MRVAILGYFDYHLECIGFMLEVYNNKNNSIDIYLKRDIDYFDWIKYYLTLYNFNIIYDKISKDIINNYDKVFKLTSNDDCLDDKNIISILHLDGKPQKKCKSEKFISLTPYIQGKNIYYTFPIYSPILSDCSNYSKIVTMIGHYTNNDFDNDTINFINNNMKYQFFFVIRGDRSYPNLKNLQNVKLFTNLKTDDINTIINYSKFILSKKNINYDRFSGQLSLAMSYEKPLIIDVKTKNAYNLPGITFENDYSEIGFLDDITDEKYKSIKNQIKSLKIDLIYKNKEVFNSMF